MALYQHSPIHPARYQTTQISILRLIWWSEWEMSLEMCQVTLANGLFGTKQTCYLYSSQSDRLLYISDYSILQTCHRVKTSLFDQQNKFFYYYSCHLILIVGTSLLITYSSIYGGWCIFLTTNFLLMILVGVRFIRLKHLRFYLIHT